MVFFLLLLRTLIAIGKYTVRITSRHGWSSRWQQRSKGPGQRRTSSPPSSHDSNIQKQKPKWEPPPPTRIGKKKRRGPNVASKLPTVTPTARCKLRLLKQLRIKDHLLMEEEVVALYQARQREKELKDGKTAVSGNRENEDENLLATLKGSPLGVGSLEEVPFVVKFHD